MGSRTNKTGKICVNNACYFFCKFRSKLGFKFAFFITLDCYTYLNHKLF